MIGKEKWEKKTIKEDEGLKNEAREQKLRWATSVDCVSGESQIDDENKVGNVYGEIEWERESESFWRNQGLG